MAEQQVGAGSLSTRHLARMAVLFVAAAIGVILAAAGASAAPVAPDVSSTVTQPDGERIELAVWGDEFVHGRETLDGYTAVRASTGVWEYAVRGADGELVASGVRIGRGEPPAPRHVRPSRKVITAEREKLRAPGTASAASSGAPAWAGPDSDVLFLAVEFSNRSCTFTPAQMRAVMFGGAATGPGDLDDYFREISGGALELDGRVVGNALGTGCIRLPNTRNHYDEGPGNAKTLVADAVAIADLYTDFRPFDNDNDGNVDILGIIYAGGGPHDGCVAEDGNDHLWPHFSGTGGTATMDGKTVNPYIINSEITFAIGANTCNVMQTIGLFAHEMGHALGLPDLYDVDGSSRGGVGQWSTMASQYTSTVNLSDSPAHYDPWSKSMLGWVEPQDLTGKNAAVVLDQVVDDGDVIQLGDNPDGPEQGGSGEYFLVENRQNAGFDSALPGCGVLVWHIEESQTSNEGDEQTADSHRLVQLHQADGRGDIDGSRKAGNGADDGDPYPGSTGNRLFADTTVPSANRYGGEPSGARVSVPGDCSAAMALNVGRPNADLAVTVLDSPDPVAAGSLLTYHLTVRNDGPGTAFNTRLEHTLPAGVTHVSNDGDCTPEQAVVTCDIGTLDAGQSRIVKVQSRVPSAYLADLGQATANLRSTSVVASDEPDGKLSNNTVQTTTAVVESADLRITKVCKPDGPAQAGDTAHCELLVDNLGPSDARGLQLRDAITSDKAFSVQAVTAGGGGASCVGGNTNNITSLTVECTRATLAAGERWTAVVPFTASGSGDVNDTGTVSSQTPDPVNGNNLDRGAVRFVSTADLSTAMSAPLTIVAGELIEYAVTVANAGPSTALGVVVENVLPEGLTLESVTPSVGSCEAGVPGDPAQPIRCAMGSLAPAAQQTIAVTARVRPDVPEGTRLFNRAVVRTASDDLNNANNAASRLTTVQTIADVGVVAEPHGAPVAGTVMSYRYEVTNIGPSTARTVTLRDRLPAGMEFKGAFHSQGGQPGAGIHCTAVTQGTNEWACPLGDLPPSSAPLQLIVNAAIRPDVPHGTTLTSAISAASPTGDPEQANNATSVDVVVDTRADLAVRHTSDGDVYKPSSTIQYTVDVTNRAPSDAQDVVLTYALPAERQAIYRHDDGGCSLAGLTLTCVLDTVRAGETKTVNIYVTVKGSKGEIVSTATAGASTADPVATNDSVTRRVLIKGGL